MNRIVQWLASKLQWKPMASTDNETSIKLVPEVPKLTPAETLPINTPTMPKQTYLWNTPADAKHSVRLICDEERLTFDQKNTLCATIGGVS